MGDVIEIKPSKKHRSGHAICRGCRHEWVAVTEGDDLDLECPSCITMKGTFKWTYGAGVGQFAFVCNCGCEDFFIMAKTETAIAGVFCRNCGEEKDEWWNK